MSKNRIETIYFFLEEKALNGLLKVNGIQNIIWCYFLELLLKYHPDKNGGVESLGELIIFINSILYVSNPNYNFLKLFFDYKVSIVNSLLTHKFKWLLSNEKPALDVNI